MGQLVKPEIYINEGIGKLKAELNKMSELESTSLTLLLLNWFKIVSLKWYYYLDYYY